jgi:alpha-ketoglutarate-dependent taurine dioxygenase
MSEDRVMTHRARAPGVRVVHEAVARLREHGFVHLPRAGESVFRDLAASLGETIHRTQVVVRTDSKALVTSDRALAVHTDHPKADYVAWFCHRPAVDGGASVLVDGWEALASIPSRLTDKLERVALKEHRVFPDDSGSHPLLSYRNGQPVLYYSFWLVEEPREREVLEAVCAFREAVDRVPRRCLRLERGAVLVVDNRRILHGRTAIHGGPGRHLERLWIRRQANPVTSEGECRWKPQ